MHTPVFCSQTGKAVYQLPLRYQVRKQQSPRKAPKSPSEMAHPVQKVFPLETTPSFKELVGEINPILRAAF